MSSKFLFFGHRLLALKSTSAGEELWEDVPEHFGRFYPSLLRLPSKEVQGSLEGRWFASQLRQIVQQEPCNYSITLKSPEVQAEEVLFINCLDPVFGHALYKLAAARATALQTKNCDVFVILSANLLPYAEFPCCQIVVEEPLSRLLIPSNNLTSAVEGIAEKYRRAKWAFCNTSRVGQQQFLPLKTEPSPVERNYLTFIHRDDRTWGGMPAIQTSRVNRVFARIKSQHPTLRTAVIGIGRNGSYRCDENYIQKRADQGYEQTLSRLSRESICIFAVHGSHLLVPSYHAWSTVELLPSDRFGNAIQAYWPNPDRSMIEIIYSYRMLYGDRFLLNLLPSTVARLIDSVLIGMPKLTARLDSETVFSEIR